LIAGRLSNTPDGAFCLDMLEEALSQGHPDVFNTDQGVQFTAQENKKTKGVEKQMGSEKQKGSGAFTDK
jgi:putative transposase